VVLILLVLTGCASVPPLDPARLALLPAAHELADTPYFAQERNHCGPASLAMILKAGGFGASPDALAPLVYLPARQGSLPLDMLGGARRLGAVALRIEPSVEALFEQIAQGRPVVVLQNLGLSWYPRWHYAVAIGFDRPRERVILRSGPESRQELSLATFDKTWQRSGRWAMIVATAGEVPRGISAARYTESLIALERIRRFSEARQAYLAGLERWPGELPLWVGLGNTAYAMGDLVASEQAFREATVRHPDADAPLNNLAHVLALRGKLAEARTAAEGAIALKGPNEGAARRTLEEILAREAAVRPAATTLPE
jgi:tetratricopeptide (TPR) repeat protein